MSKTIVEHIVDPSGKIIRRTTSDQEIQIVDEIVAQFASNTTSRVPNIQRWDDSSKCLHLAVRGAMLVATLWIDELVIKAPFRLVNGQMIPQFRSKEDPIMTINWSPPNDMRLAFLMTIPTPPVNGEYVCNYHYLFATDLRAAAYRLPLPNLYDDCRICTGLQANEGVVGITLMDCVSRSLDVFMAAPWGSHLIKDETVTQAFFRFEPNNEGFLPIRVPDWKTHCIKVANEITNNVLFF